MKKNSSYRKLWTQYRCLQRHSHARKKNTEAAFEFTDLLNSVASVSKDKGLERRKGEA